MIAQHHASPADRVYAAAWQDGSIDLFAGLTVAAVGVAWLFGLVALGAVLPAIAVPLWAAFRRLVVDPRLGRVRFPADRRRRLTRAQLVLIVSGCVFLGVAVGVSFALGDARPEWLRALAPALPGALVGIAGALSALLFAIPRFAGYAVAFLIGGLAVGILDVDPGFGLLAGGLVTAAAGGAMLVRFVRQFPPLSNELD